MSRQEDLAAEMLYTLREEWGFQGDSSVVQLAGELASVALDFLAPELQRHGTEES